jgi:hypothetical protein
VSATQDGFAVIAKGLKVGDKIVSDGQYRLLNGSRIKVDAAVPQAEKPAASPAGKEG